MANKSVPIIENIENLEKVAAKESNIAENVVPTEDNDNEEEPVPPKFLNRSNSVFFSPEKDAQFDDNEEPEPPRFCGKRSNSVFFSPENGRSIFR